MKKFYPITFLFLIVAAVFLQACSGKTELEKRATAVEREKEIIHIGVAWPFETANDLFSEGVQLAVDEINASGGVLNRKIELVKQDDKASVTKGLEIAQDFADNEKIAAVIGHRNSYVSLPTSAIYEKAGIVMISPASTSPDLTKGNNEFVFRNIASDDKLAEELAKHAYRKGHRKMVIVYDDDAYGEGLASSFENHAGKLGVDIVDRLSFFDSLTKLEQFKFKWETLQYDGIFIAKSNPAGAQFITDLRKIDIDMPIYAGNAMDSAELWSYRNDILDGITVGSFFNPESDREKVTEFIAAFEETYGEAPSQYSVQGYDAVYLLAAAIDEAQSVKPATIAKALRDMEDSEGVAGVHRFAENGDDVGSLFVIKRVHQGNFEYITIDEG